MNSDTVQILIRKAVVLFAGYLLQNGWVTTQGASKVENYLGGMAVLAFAFVWSKLHLKNNVASTNASSGLPRSTPLLALAAVALLMAVGTGCATAPSSGHVIRAVATGTKLGVTQNPVTGAYELGFERIQTELITTPVLFTNGGYVSPDVVSGYEVSSHSAVFGNVGLTSTMAVGTNAVATMLGGQHTPINAGVGTGSNLTPLSH